MPDSPVTILPPPPSRSIPISESTPTATDPASDKAWAELCSTNSRLHDGPILLLHPGPRCTVATYRTLATAAALHRSVRALGVQAVVIGRDSAGVEHLLLGRRGSDTRIYGGLWENAPSGSVAPPHSPATELSESDLLGALRDEGLEELGIDLAASSARWIAMLDDPEAMSTDAVFEVRTPLSHSINPSAAPCPRRRDESAWEYIDTAWIPLDQAASWIIHHAHAVSPPTRALLPYVIGRG